MTNILPNPLKLVRGRQMTVPIRFMDANRAGLDVTLWKLYCDFRYKSTDGSAIFTLSSEISPPTITKADQTAEATKGLVYLNFHQTQLNGVTIPTPSGVDFPFVQLIAELAYVQGGMTEPESAFMLRAQVFEKQTRTV